MTTPQSITTGGTGQCSLAPTAFGWWLLQLVVLALAAGGTPLILGQSQSTERWGLLLLAGTQIFAGAMFAGPLLAGGSRAVTSIAVVWPMLQLGGLLAGESQGHVLAASAGVTLWLAGMACWLAGLPQRMHTVAAAVWSAWAMGGVAMAYCRAEFGAAPGGSTFPTDGWISPLLAVMGAGENPAGLGGWTVLAGHLAAGMVVAMVAGRAGSGRRQQQST